MKTFNFTPLKWAALLATFAVCLLLTRTARAQFGPASGSYIDECSTQQLAGDINTWPDIEGTACITAAFGTPVPNPSGISTYVEISDYYWELDNGNNLASEAQIYDGNYNLVYDSGYSASGPNDGETYSSGNATATPNEWYTVALNAYADYDWLGNYSWNLGGQVEITNPPVPASALPSTPSFNIPSPLALTPTSEQSNALANVTQTQIQTILTTVTPQMQQMVQNYVSQQGNTGNYRSWLDIIAGSGGSSPSQTQIQFTNGAGNPYTAMATIRQFSPTTAPSRLAQPNYVAMPGRFPTYTKDQDGDGLPDNPSPGCGDCDFEGYLAAEFMPSYFISSGEQQQFAIFGNYVPWTVVQTIGTTPPNSYYHVTPLGLATDQGGNQVFAIRVDYLSLWNADGGLVGGGGACFYSWFGLDQVVNELSGHDLDAERSVMLLAAPAVNGGVNTDPGAYSIYSIYTAAHEGTFFDQSTHTDFSTPVPAGNHVSLSQSLSKHSTYGFNPDFFPITPPAVIAGTEVGITSAWLAGEIDDFTYGALIAAADDVFYGCLVERFGNQGGQVPTPTINVGEVPQPINGSGFIQDDSARALYLADKLNNRVF